MTQQAERGHKVEKLLCHAHDLLARKNGWANGALARTRNRSIDVDPTSDVAYSFCSLGALERARHDLQAEGAVFEEAVRRLSTKMMPHYQGSRSGIIHFNDAQPRKKPVIAKFCETIRQTREDYRLEKRDE